MRELLEACPELDGAAVANDLMALGALQALGEQGRRVPDDVALIGFDDIPLADMLDPAITVVAQDPQAIGRAAADQLFRRLDGDTAPAVHLIIPVTLRARGSGEIPAASPAPR